MEVDWAKGIPEFLKYECPTVEVQMVETEVRANPAWELLDRTYFWEDVVIAQPMTAPRIFYFDFQYPKQGIKLSEFKFTDWEFK